MTDLYVTANISTLLASAKTNALAILGAYATAISNWRGTTGAFDPAQFFNGTVSFQSYVGQLSNQQLAPVRDVYNAVNTITQLSTFVALAPSTTQVSFETWSWLNNIATQAIPTNFDTWKTNY